MEPLIEPVAVSAIEAELTPDKYLRDTNFGGNQIYTVTYHDSPATCREVGRLREMAFRQAGGGTGLACDLDEYDTQPRPYSQLVVWSPAERRILGGYRYALLSDMPRDPSGVPQVASARLFEFSDTFKANYMDATIELGRSFVHPSYQSTSEARRSIFALDNLWDGLGALVVANPQAHYFFGKVTMYPSYDRQARDLLLYFLRRHFPDRDNLVRLIDPLPLDLSDARFAAFFPTDNYAENKRILNTELRKRGETVPPLINAYMSLSPTMRTFGTSMNASFGNVEETAILIDVRDIYPAKIERHVRVRAPRG